MSLLFKLYHKTCDSHRIQRLLNPSRAFSSTSPLSNPRCSPGPMKWGVFPSPIVCIGFASSRSKAPFWRTKADGRRARQDSPTEMTDSKRRLTDPDEYSSLYHRLCTICEELPSNFLSLFLEDCIGDLADAILKNSESDGFFEMALELLQKLVEDRPRISGDEFSLLVCQVWLNPILLHGLRSVIEKKDPVLISFVTSYAKQDYLPTDPRAQMSYANQEYLPTDRMAQMEADPCFKPCLMAIKSASRNNILRVFLSILIGYWSDKGQFTEMDKRMGKDFFGWRMEMIAKSEAMAIARARKEMIAKSEAMAIARAGKEDKIEDISFDIKDISDAKDLEPLRQLLVSRYGGGGEVDVEDILEKAKKNIPQLLNISLRLGYDGKKARIEYLLFDGSYGNWPRISW